jgi:hypothetical protein
MNDGMPALGVTTSSARDHHGRRAGHHVVHSKLQPPRLVESPPLLATKAGRKSLAKTAAYLEMAIVHDLIQRDGDLPHLALLQKQRWTEKNPNGIKPKR